MKTRFFQLLLAALLSASAAAQAGGINIHTSLGGGVEVRIDNGKPRAGNGQTSTVSRSLPAYRRIELRSAENLRAVIAPAATLQLTGDSNLLELVGTRVQGDTLIIEALGSYRSRTPILVSVQLPVLDAVQVEGSADAVVSGLAAERFKVEISGSGNIEASGSAHELEVALDGSGNAALRALAAQRAVVEINGSGNVTVQARERLRAEINGSGDIRYGGAPAEVKAEVNGSGRIRPL